MYNIIISVSWPVYITLIDVIHSHTFSTGHVGLYKLHAQEVCPSKWWTEIYSYESYD